MTITLIDYFFKYIRIYNVSDINCIIIYRGPDPEIKYLWKYSILAFKMSVVSFEYYLWIGSSS